MTAQASAPQSALKVCILWHMHQPDYRDPISGQTLLPWTWLHGVKDYAEMLETIRETGARVTVNLVPSLLEQLERYAQHKDQDRWLQLASTPPGQLSDEERRFMVEHFFSVNEDTQILPNHRYHQLYLQRGSGHGTVQNFSDQDLLDLQVWFLLAWTGSHLRRRSRLVADLLGQQGLFREEQKQQLLECCHEELSRVIDLHRELESAGLIEISVTPYAHPILPLLCDLQVAQEPSPGLPLPAADFQHPEDARLQVREGLRTAERIFGPGGRGMWPSEGAVSAAAVTLMAEEGVRWAASDEDILARSLPEGLAERAQLYRIYSYADLPLLFRDRELSDRIGFLYAGWETAEAVNDLLDRLRRIAGQAPGGTVAIILDGENCWERYADNGYPFLRDFYTALNEDPHLEMSTIDAALRNSRPEPLENLAAGSWIRGDFTTWIGHPEENRAWELLHQARNEIFSNELSEVLESPAEPPGDLVRELLRAEGSDWFWWYGDEHVTAQADIFDRLFRLHLEGLYHLRGLPVPARLHQAIKPVTRKISGFEPTACFSPQIDGRINDYFEWLAAGCLELSAGGAMYASRAGLRELYYGYDREQLYFRIDQADLLKRLCGRNGHFEIRLSGRIQLTARYALGSGELQLVRDGAPVGRGRAACRQVLEIAVPLAELQLDAGEQLQVSCHALHARRENGRWPTEGHALLCYRGQALDEENWSV